MRREESPEPSPGGPRYIFKSEQEKLTEELVKSSLNGKKKCQDRVASLRTREERNYFKKEGMISWMRC